MSSAKRLLAAPPQPKPHPTAAELDGREAQPEAAPAVEVSFPASLREQPPGPAWPKYDSTRLIWLDGESGPSHLVGPARGHSEDRHARD